MSCYALGSQQLVQDLQDTWGSADGGTTADGELTVQVVNGCLGVCDRAPIVKLDSDFHGDLDVGTLNDVLRRAIAAGGGWAEHGGHGGEDGHHG